jgi:hypothetical protein
MLGVLTTAGDMRGLFQSDASATISCSNILHLTLEANLEIAPTLSLKIPKTEWSHGASNLACLSTENSL